MNPSESTDPFERVLPKVHEAVRKSLLMNVMHNKLQSLSPGAFPFATAFGDLREVIAPQIGDTRVLFPEFTPHDELLHVAKLFQLSDKLFGDSYQNMNVSELFLLACGLYAHDWGMAVGKEEKEYLRSGCNEQYLRDSFSPLPDEAERLEAFIRAEGLQLINGVNSHNLSDHHLRLYVRLTHARRSGARVRAHFQDHPSVGAALAHICEGHWHDFATLDDPQRFPRDYQVADQNANILALALQIRLIDLFHITDDRTPYALWRFVSPANKRSAQEWEKHSALHAVIPMPFYPGRAIRVQGFTEHEEVWAGLQDLRRYCDDQIVRTLDLCARHVPERFMLNFVKLEWDVPTGDLRPIDLKFGFDNKAVFRILSEDVYDGDNRVFLRELLQNAIDAVRTRRARHNQRVQTTSQRRQLAPSFDVTIYFNAVHHDDGDITVSCRDYGIGMDEHIIRNYFAVAGVSYYRSELFERQHLGFEPVSRFGIGILSCFMVADAIDVKTYRDPECGPPMARSDSQLPGNEEHWAKPLHLQIPAVDRQFIVKHLSGDFQVGTEVTLTVKKGKFEQTAVKSSDCANSTSFQRTLEISEYLCDIAGFVEFPILVQESWPGLSEPKRTLILHPSANAAKEIATFVDDVAPHQLMSEYPWEEVIAPESQPAIDHLMAGDKIDLSEILAKEGYEGWVVYPRPISSQLDFSQASWGESDWVYAGDQLLFRDRSDQENRIQTIYLREDQRSKKNKKLFGIYRDGILINNIKDSSRISGGGCFPAPLIKINLSTSVSPHTTISRASLYKKSKAKWDKPILEAVKEHFINRELSNIEAKVPAERLYYIGWLIEVFGLPPSIDRSIPGEKSVSLWLDDNGEIICEEGQLKHRDRFFVVPSELERYTRQLLSKFYDLPDKRDPNHLWRGPKSLLSFPELSPHSRVIGNPISQAVRMSERLGGKQSHYVELYFIEPPAGYSMPIGLPMYELGAQDLSDDDDDDDDTQFEHHTNRADLLKDEAISESLTLAVSKPNSLTAQQTSHVRNTVWADELVPVAFAEPFSKKFMAHPISVNLLHPVGIQVLRCLAACALAERDNKLPETARAQLRKIGHRVSNKRITISSRGHSVNLTNGNLDVRNCIAELFQLVEQHQLIDGFNAPEIPDGSEWVPTMQNKVPTDFSVDPQNIGDLTSIVEPFGRLITQWPLPPV